MWQRTDAERLTDNDRVIEKATPKKDKSREDRITLEVVVDAYDENERALGRYYYLEDKLAFPFKAKCIAPREISPLKRGEEVKVVGMPSEEEC